MLRDASVSDVACFANIDAAATAFPWSRTQYEQSLRDHQCRVLTVDGAIVGFLVYTVGIDEAELLNVVVSPEHQRRGYGRRLVEDFIGINRGGAERLFLEVRDSNDSAIRLYQSLGFFQCGTRKGYYPAEQGREDARVMVYEY